MIIESTRFGQLDISETNIIKFPQGLCGFPDEKSFILISHQPDSEFSFLQSVSEPDLTFIMLETLALSEEYDFTLSDEVVAELNLSATNPPQIFNIVTNKGNVDDMTVNLSAPVIINVNQCLAKQVILENVEYKTSHRIFIEGAQKIMMEGKK